MANAPAYIKNYNRHFVQAGSRWSFSMPIPKKGGYKDHYLPYPFFLGYSSALLKRDTEADVKTVDPCALDFDEETFISFVKSYGPDVLLMEVPTISFPLVMEIIKEIKDIVGCKVALTGGHVTALTEDVMEKHPFIDYCLLGEYELTLRELIKYLGGERDDGGLGEIEGLAFRDKEKIIVNEKRKFLMELDALPFPDRNDLAIQHYHDFEIAGKPSAQMLTSRGCPSGCIFCLERHVIYASPLYRRRAPSKIVSEMNLVREKYKAKQVYFDDETMTMNRSHIRSICEEIIYNGLDMPWTCMGDITLDYETLKIMTRAGCVGIKFGVETINTKTLIEVKKTFVDVEKVKQFVRWCKELGIWTHATYVIGLPGDTRDDIQRSLKFAIKLDNDSAQFSIATPYPGTPFFELARENGWLLTYDWTLYDGANHSVISYPWLRKDEIEELFRSALKHYYRNAIIRGLINPRRIFRILRAGGMRYAMNKAVCALRT